MRKNVIFRYNKRGVRKRLKIGYFLRENVGIEFSGLAIFKNKEREKKENVLATIS